MKIFIDSADLNEIRLAASMGLVDGVTTNPSLVAKSGKSLEFLLPEICKIVDGPISAEVTSMDAEGMLQEAAQLVKVHPNVVIKLPLTLDGLRATRALSKQGTKVNVTLCFSAVQALLAAKAGATYISPFVGRLDDIATDGMQLIQDIRTIYNNYDFKTEILVASIRHPVHVLDAARIGADVATLPYKVIEQLAKHPLTEAGLATFMRDWEKSKK